MLKSFNKYIKNPWPNQIISRSYGVKKILPLDPEYIESLPVYEYPRKSPSDRTLYGWGLTEHGALGHYIQKKKKMRSRKDERFRRMIKPVRMDFGEYHKVKDIAAGYGFSVFAVNSNTEIKVFGCGLNTDSQIGYHSVRKDHPLEILLSPVPIHIGFKEPTKTKVIGLSAGRAHLIVNTDLEGAFLLGNNSYGQCGRSIIENENYLGSRIVHNISNIDGEKIQSVECGQDHSLFLTESGKVYSCGWGADGQTGLGHYNVESKPKRVLGDIEREKIVKLSSKSDCVLAINDKGEVFGWGNSEYNQVLDESDLSQQINKSVHIKKCEGFGKIIDVAAAGSYCLMLNEAGDVFAWGYGILGFGPNVTHTWKPKLIPPILFGRNDFTPNSKVTSIYCGLNHSAAITNYGNIYTWGKNKECCLGLGRKGDQFFPMKVFINALGKKVSLGVDHSLALCGPL